MASKTDVLHIGEENEEILSRKTEMDFYWVPVTDWLCADLFLGRSRRASSNAPSVDTKSSSRGYLESTLISLCR